MVPRAFALLEKEFSVPKATFIIAVFTVLSRVSGFIRTRLFTSEFGAGQTLDIYFASFRIPDFLMNVLILGTLSVALLPVLSHFLLRDKKEAYRLARVVLSWALFGMALVCGIAAVLAEPIMRALVPGFSQVQLESVVMLTRLVLAAQVVFAVSSLYTTILNAHKHFLVAAFAPIIYNIGIIIGLLVFYPRFGLAGLGYGVIMGSLLHLGIQAIELVRLGFWWVPRFRVDQPGLANVVKLYIPRLFFLDLSQISLLVASVLGSLLSAGSIAVFNLAFDLQAVPTGVFAISTATAAFPLLSESFSSNNKKLFWDTLSKSTVQILFFIIPVSIAVLIFRAYIVRILYGAGEFNWDDTRATFQVLGIFTFSLFSQALVPLFSRALYARHNTRLPVVIGLLAVIVNLAVAYMLAPRFGIQGVAYGFTVASILNALVLYVCLRWELGRDIGAHKTIAHEFDLRLLTSFIKIVIASVLLGAVSFVALRLVEPFVNTATGLGILIQASISAGLGGLAFLAVAYMLGLEELHRVAGYFKRWLAARK